MTSVKRCPRCGQLKSAAGFYRRRHSQRLSSYCQPCTHAASRQAHHRRRHEPAAIEGLRTVDRVRQRRRRALGDHGGGNR
jgi:hypothetical protein